MVKKDDCTLEVDQLREVKKHVRKLLNTADAIGRFPTPVDDILEAAKLEVREEVCLKNDFLSYFREFGSVLEKKTRPIIHEAKSFIGALHVPSGEIFLDHSQHPNAKIWTKLHETGHGYLPHQKDLYELLEDGDREMDPETEDLFEREANNFAGESLYQLETFEKIAADYTVSIKTPKELQKQFGGSIYASMRRYTITHFKPLALAVYNPIEFGSAGSLFRLRRTPFASASFFKRFGSFPWPDPCTEESFLWSLLRFKKFSDDHLTIITDLRGEDHECRVHLFSNSYQIFVLLIPKSRLSRIISPFGTGKGSLS